MSKPEYTSISLGPISESAPSEIETPTQIAKPYRSVRNRRRVPTRVRSATRDMIIGTNHLANDVYESILPVVQGAGRAVHDLEWKHVLKTVLLHLLGLGFLALGIVLLTYISLIPGLNLDQYSQTCQPDGSFAPLATSGYEYYDSWSTSGFFQITIGFGDLAFTTVKIIDVVWDVIVGRGGQGVMAGISYVVFSKSLLRTMEKDAVSYGTFEALTFQTASVSSIFKLTRDFLTNGGLRARLVIAWIILSSTYIVAFPTLISAMTGYSANSQAFVPDSSGSLTHWSDFVPVIYMISDGLRINLTQEVFLTDQQTELDQYGRRVSCSEEGTPSYSSQGTLELETDWHVMSPECRLLWHVSTYAGEFGFGGNNQTKSVFNNSGQIFDLKAPTLNITAFYVPSYTSLTSPFTSYGPATAPSNSVYGLDNKTYDLAYIKEKGQCIPLATYRWGFSFLLLFITILLMTIYMIGMYVLWLDSYLYSRFDRAHRDMGTHRASLDFAAAMRKDIGEDATEVMSNSELTKRVRKGLNGWKVSYEMTDADKLPISRWHEFGLFWDRRGIHRWSRRQKLVFSAFCVVFFLLVVVLPVTLHMRSGYHGYEY